jgi:hypothetical protein
LPLSSIRFKATTDGYWLNIPQAGANCPTCRNTDPAVAVQFIETFVVDSNQAKATHRELWSVLTICSRRRLIRNTKSSRPREVDFGHLSMSRAAPEGPCPYHEHLSGQQFDSLLEAKVLPENWRTDYNMCRAHSAHGWLTPVEFVEAWLNQQQLALA